MRLILASQSPARLTVLRRAGVEPVVMVADVDEEAIVGTDPADTALQRAVAKATSVSADGVIVGCDSILEVDGRASGKPGTADAARRQWLAMRGRVGHLHTGHCVVRGERLVSRVATTAVHFADLSDDEIDAYIHTGEPLWVAGAFTIDGYGAPFVSSIEGDPHNVIGISVPLLRTMLREVGVEWINLWTPDQSAS